MDLALFALRAVVGLLFMGHGAQKLFGSFGGHGLDGTGQFFESLGLRPGRRHATFAGASEMAGGALLALGLFTPLAAAAIIGVMAVAVLTVHGPKGPWVTEGGYEYNAVLIAAMLALAESGPGKPSVDAALFPRMKGTGWALLALAAGTAGSYLATEYLNEPAPPAPETVTEDEPRFERDEVPAEEEPRFEREQAPSA
jgi:putative oxidoreductase